MSRAIDFTTTRRVAETTSRVLAAVSPATPGFFQPTTDPLCPSLSATRLSATFYAFPRVDNIRAGMSRRVAPAATTGTLKVACASSDAGQL